MGEHMTREVQSSHSIQSSIALTTPPPQATIDAMNYLYYTTIGLQNSRGDKNAPLNLQMLAKAIGEVAATNPPYADQPTWKIWLALTGGSSPPVAGSIADLASKYLASPGDGTVEGPFQQVVDNGLGCDINDWWSSEGLHTNGATHNIPPTLIQSDVQDLSNAIAAYMANKSTANLTAVIDLLKKVQTEIPSGTLDPYTQMLQDLLNTAIMPGEIGSWQELANDTPSQLSTVLNYFGGSLSAQINLFISKEFNNT